MEIYRLMGEYSDRRSVRNLHIWLFLAKLVFAEGEGEIADDGEVTYWLRQVKSEKSKVKRGEDEEFFAVKADDLSLYLNGSHYVNDNHNDNDNKLSAAMRRKVEIPGVLDWADELVGKGGQGGLTQLPIDTITIGKKQWRLPSALITSVTYEQYTNAQQLQQAVWGLTDNLRQEQQRIMDEIRSTPNGANGANKDGSHSSHGLVSEETLQHRIMEEIRSTIGSFTKNYD